MTLPVREHPGARADLDAATDWYDNPAVGYELLHAVLLAQQSIAEMPHTWPTVHGWHREPVLRRRSVLGFPYSVIYYVTDHEIMVVAYAHDRRRPGYWKHRVTH